MLQGAHPPEIILFFKKNLVPPHVLFSCGVAIMLIFTLEGEYEYTIFIYWALPYMRQVRGHKELTKVEFMLKHKVHSSLCFGCPISPLLSECVVDACCGRGAVFEARQEMRRM